MNLDHVQLRLRTALLGMIRPPARAPVLLAVSDWRAVAEAHSKASNSGVHPRGGGGQTVTVALYADSATSPGALLTTIGTLPDTSLSLTPADFDFPLVSAYPLATNQRYWIGLSTSNGSTAAWVAAADDTGFGVAKEFWDASGTVTPNTDPPFQMEVGAAPRKGPAPTPAPPSVISVLIGLLGVGLYFSCKRFEFAR